MVTSAIIMAEPRVSRLWKYDDSFIFHLYSKRETDVDMLFPDELNSFISNIPLVLLAVNDAMPFAIAVPFLLTLPPSSL
jgi:hypothetical protein